MTALLPHDERGFHHEAVLYDGDDAFAAATLPFIREGLANDEPTLVVVSSEKIERLRDELGSGAELVHFSDMAEVGTNPARIIPVWQEFVAANLTAGNPVRGIGEPVWPGRSDPELAECDRHESLLNLAFDDGPGWRLLCPYDTSTLSGDAIAAARRNHPHLLVDGESLASGDYLSPLDGPSPFEGELSEPLDGFDEVLVTVDGLAAARALICERARDAGLTEPRAADLVLAADEALGNSVRHGGGEGTLRVWRESATLICEIEDRGEISDRLAGRRRPAPDQGSGYGLWLINQLCDLVQIRSGSGATVLRLHMALQR